MSLHLLPRPLRYVEAVAEHGSVQAASRALGIAASAIDRQIHALEEASQTPLFERLPRGMRPTAAGEAVIVMARRWRADAERLDDGLREMRGQERGVVRLAAMDSLANGLLPELAEWLQAEHPRIQLACDVLTPPDAARALDEGTADLALAFNLSPSRNHHAAWSTDLPFGCVVAPAHPLAALDAVTVADLARHPTVSQSAVLPSRRYLETRYGWLFADNPPALLSNSLQLLKGALAGGRMAMLTSELDVLPELERGTLVWKPLREPGLRPQTIALAVDARRPLTRAGRIVLERLAARAPERLAALRAAREEGGR
ncbi:LysR family transcriptional regulator [Albimonas pacifica]|uniref:DNA-binding transcriptional regulator, LysR family n=1 Tax=Albimonas pacifica TaxID=1114924 RepID=A0A1I3DDM1_9RHOB|nr:LysR family transcriptional regulator [Albimonas pacifica]SFH84571.1 DNA-binding transcriptional regulator, LysR family [Albimonas pacifica]